MYNSTRKYVHDENKKKTMEKNAKRKNSVEELNELSIVGGNDGNPEPRCSFSNIIITTILFPRLFESLLQVRIDE